MGLLDAPGLSRPAADLRYSASAATKLLGFGVAIANRANQPVDILGLGDSVMEGQGVYPGALNLRWASQTIKALRQAYPLQGVTGGFGYKPAWNSPNLSSPAVSGTTTQATNGLGHRSLTLGSAGASVTYTETCTSFKLLLKRTGTDAVTVSIDGSTSTIAAGPTGEYVWTSAALYRGSHSIVITQTAGTPEVEGLMLYDGDEAAGIRYWDSSKSGAKAADFSTVSGGSQAWLAAAAAAGFAPSLVWIGYGFNDAVTNGGNKTAATFKTDAANVIAAVRGQWANVPILLIGNYQPPSRQSPNTRDPWAAYGTALRQLADADPAVAYLDQMNRIGSITTDLYGFLDDATHPSKKGHLYYADQVTDVLRFGIKDTDVVNSPNLKSEYVQLDTPAGTLYGAAGPAIPPAPTWGSVLFADSRNGAALAIDNSGGISNALAKTVSLTGANTIRMAWRYIRTTTGASNVTHVLPQADYANEEHTFKKVDSGTGTLSIQAHTSQTIEGATTKTMTGQWAWITIRSTGIGSASGVGWEIIGQGGTIS